MAITISQAGKDKLESELKRLKTVERPAVIQAIAEARGHGDLSENAEYDAARDQQAHLEGRIIEIESMLANANVIDITKLKTSNSIMFGATVKIVDEETDEKKTYTIVSEVEADLSNGLISNTSPIGRALIGRKVGDSIEVQVPNGTKYFEILKIKYAL